MSRPSRGGGLVTLKTRAEFKRVRGGVRAESPAFVIETKAGEAERGEAAPRFGFTITRKTGGAVVRNRIRRRLKAAVMSEAGAAARPGHDYVLVARPAAAEMPYAELCEAVRQALARIHRKPVQKRQQPS